MLKKKIVILFVIIMLVFSVKVNADETNDYLNVREKISDVVVDYSDAEEKISQGIAVKFDTEEEANNAKAYLEFKGYTELEVKYNNPIIQNILPIHWYGSTWYEHIFRIPKISYPIYRESDYIVLTQDDVVWVIPLKKDRPLTGDMIEEILKQSRLTEQYGYEFSNYGQFEGFDEVTYFTEDDRTLRTYGPSYTVEHEMTSDDKIGWTKRIDIAGGPTVDFDWDCYFANDDALDYAGGGQSGFHGTITDDICLIHSCSDTNRPDTYSTGIINWERPEFGYYLSLKGETPTLIEPPIPEFTEMRASTISAGRVSAFIAVVVLIIAVIVISIISVKKRKNK